MPRFLKPGEVFARKYKILRELGEGGFANTYLAEHMLLEGQIVALKVLRPELWERPELRARFQQEARIAMCLRHPNIIPIWEFDVTADGFPFYTMEASRGDTLKKFLDREGRFDLLRAIRVIRQVLDALAAAHALKIIHRDVKPNNIMFEVGPEGEVVRLFDFGLAKMLARPDPTIPSAALGSPKYSTSPTQLVGTPRYVSPEQARHDPIDARCDIYSTGIVLYELLAGRLPFLGPTALDYLRQHISEPPMPFEEACPGVEIPAEVEGVVMMALEKDPAARYQTARAFADALDRLLPVIMDRQSSRSFIVPRVEDLVPDGRTGPADPACFPIPQDLVDIPPEPARKSGRPVAQAPPAAAEPPPPVNWLYQSHTGAPPPPALPRALAPPPPAGPARPAGRRPDWLYQTNAGFSQPAPEAPAPEAPEGKPSQRLQFRHSFGGTMRILHVSVGKTATFGRQRRPDPRQRWDEIPTFAMRYLPVDDPSQRQATEATISPVHFQVTIDASNAFVTDLSTIGTSIDGNLIISRVVPAPIDQGSVITIGPGPLALQATIYRHSRTKEIVALKLTRRGNEEHHAYLLLADAAPIGSAPGAAVRLDEALGVRPLHAIVRPRDAECLMIEPCGGAPVAVAGYKVPPNGAAPLLPGFRATLANATLALAAYFPDSEAAFR